MAGDLHFRCDCGEVQGILHGMSPKAAIRYVCFCDDCQVYAAHLDRPDTLRDDGGTEAFQVDASKLEITRGLERLACMTVRKPFKDRWYSTLLRWYAGCCNTPIAATYDTSRLSFLSFLYRCTDSAARDNLLPPAKGQVWTKFAEKDVGRDTNLGGILTWLFRRLFLARLTGDHRRNVLFDPSTGNPIVAPFILPPAQRAAIEDRIRLLNPRIGGAGR